MKTAYVFCILMAMTFVHCSEPYQKRFIRKSLRLHGEDASVEWYYYSLIGGYSPGHIDLKMPHSHQLICESTYISDIRLQHDSLFIQLWKDVHKEFDIFLQFNTRLDLRLKVFIDSAVGQQPL
ncbi:MAG TPA: hypothetical protein VG605_09735 [Puia sp.]|nr:hypothetical protein [Puia sp.]